MSLLAIPEALTPLETILAVCGLVAFLLACMGFLKLVWSISWTLRGWVESQNDQQKEHSEKLSRLVEIFGEFVRTQKEANVQTQEGQRLLAERLDRFDAEREDVHRAVRAMNRKLNYIEGEDVKVEQRPA